MLKQFALTACAAAGLLALSPTTGRVSAMPALHAGPATGTDVEMVRYRHHRRHRAAYPSRPADGVPDYGYEGGPGYGDPGGASSFGGFANRGNGAPPDNEFDPTRPYGGQAAITAPPGTDAYEEQANERRYFCEFSPSRC